MKIDHLRKLHQKKYRQESGLFLIEGEHLLLELERTALDGCTIYVTERHKEWQSRFPVKLISERQMAQTSETRSPQGLLATVPMDALSNSTLAVTSDSDAKPAERCVYLYEVQDPGNLGTILRTLAWFGNWRCLLSPNSVDPFNSKAIRSSMGAIFHVPLELGVPLEAIEQRFSSVATLDMNGKPLTEAASQPHDCLVFGNEARGVPQQALPDSVAPYTIPGSGLIESLNLASAVNMAVYELSR